MNNLTSLLSQNYKSLEQPALVKLVEQIEEVVKELDKRCEYCNDENERYILEVDLKCNFCPNCGCDLRKEENINEQIF